LLYIYLWNNGTKVIKQPENLINKGVATVPRKGTMTEQTEQGMEQPFASASAPSSASSSENYHETGGK
jgi:hypothetical protein